MGGALPCAVTICVNMVGTAKMDVHFSFCSACNVMPASKDGAG